MSRDANRPRPPVRLAASAAPGIHWPAVPSPDDALLLSLMQQMEQSQWWAPRDLLAMQLRQLHSLARHAEATVPFYRDRLAGITALKQGHLTLEHWFDLPILTRADLQQHGEVLQSRNLPSEHGPTHITSSSGSTGRPISALMSRLTTIHANACDLRNQMWHRHSFGATVGSIQLRISDAAKHAAKHNLPSGWAHGHHSGPRYPCDISRPVREQLSWLKDLDPDYLQTYPSNLAALLRLSEEVGWRPTKLRKVTTRSETLNPALREDCRRLWGAGIVDTYSAMEVGGIALQCPVHDENYHVQSENVFVEVVDEHGRPCEPGRLGRVIVTPLQNFATPLLRYEVGDMAVPGAFCPCGRGLPVLKSIFGHYRAMILLPNGDRIYPGFSASRMLAAVPVPVKQYQFVQTDRERITMRLAAERPLTDEERAALIAWLRPVMRYDFEFDFDYVDEIERSPNGKFEEFKSELLA